MFYTYITTNKRNGTLYIGQTSDLGSRMEQHKYGLIKGFAHKWNCHHLVWLEAFETRGEAFKRERSMKKWNRGWKLRLIEDSNPNWIDLTETPLWPLPDKPIFAELRQKIIREHALLR